MLEGFALQEVTVAPGVRLRVRTGGSGPAVVLLHGHPRTHTTWHRVAPRLVAAGFTVVCPDLRGYGRSTAPEPRPDSSQASKRAMAGDVVALLRGLGHERFAVVGHDRGGYVAHRLAMDHPDAVTHLAVLDGVPIGEALARADARFATAWWHWFFYARRGAPERVITADPDAWYGTEATDPGRAARMGEENHADHLAAVRDPAVVRAMLEDYRAGLGVDRAADDADRAAGRRVACPTLVAWSADDGLADLYGDVLAVWRPWAADLRGAVIPGGHHMAEEAPEELSAAVLELLGAPGSPWGGTGGPPDPASGGPTAAAPGQPGGSCSAAVQDHLDAARTGYDAVAADYARLVTGLSGESDLELAMLSTFVTLLRQDDPAGTVVDVGCGTGRLTAHLRDQGLDAVGVDLSPGMLAQARAAHPHLRFTTGTVTDLDLPDASCAGALSWYSLLHLPPEHLPRALSELARVLRPGGLLLLGFHVGRGHRVISGAYGPPVDIDAWDMTLEAAVALTEGAGLQVRARLQRQPLGRERRDQASLLCRKPPVA